MEAFFRCLPEILAVRERWEEQPVQKNAEDAMLNLTGSFQREVTVMSKHRTL